MVVHTYNPCTEVVKQEDHEFEACLGNLENSSQPVLYHTIQQARGRETGRTLHQEYKKMVWNWGGISGGGKAEWSHVPKVESTGLADGQNVVANEG